MFTYVLMLFGCADESESQSQLAVRENVEKFIKSGERKISLAEIYNGAWDFACWLGPYTSIDSEVGGDFRIADELPWALADNKWGIAFFDDRRRLSFHFTFDRRRIDIGYAEPRCVPRRNAILRITETHNIELIESIGSESLVFQIPLIFCDGKLLHIVKVDVNDTDLIDIQIYNSTKRTAK